MRVHLGLLVALVGVGCGSSLFTQVTEESRDGVGLNVSSLTSFGVNIDPQNPAGNPSGWTLAMSGVSTVRFTFKDPTLSGEPSAAAISTYQHKLAELDRHGIRALVVLSYETLPGFPVQSTSKAAWD